MTFAPAEREALLASITVVNRLRGPRTVRSIAADGSSKLNGTWHARALAVFAAVVALHWVEHIAQAIQIWGLGYKPSAAHGLIGAEWPWLVTSEWLHYTFALLMLVGLIILRPGFRGRARTFWTIALVIQIWHFFEHQILLIQAITHQYWFGGKVPTSVLQAVWPMDRVEIHLVYNTLVTIPMVVAMYFHAWPPPHERLLSAECSCDRTISHEPALAA